MTRIPQKVIAIAAGKGGVGKSVITVLLAKTAQLLGKKVGIIDADLYGPSLPYLLPPQTMPYVQEGVVMPACCSNITYISPGLLRKEGVAAIVRAPVANRMIEQFFDVEFSDRDLLFVDFPPGTGDIQLTMLQTVSFSGAILLSTPDPLSVLDVKQAGEMFQKLQVPIIGVIENMSWIELEGRRVYPFGQGGGERLSRYFSLEKPIQIPFFEEISKKLHSGADVDEFESIVEQLLQITTQCIEGDSLQNQTHFEVVWEK